MAENLDYNASVSGPQIDEAVKRAVIGGDLDVSLLKKIELVNLWENASPSSEFPAQRISADLSGCEFAMIVAVQHASVPANRRVFIVQLNTYSPLSFLSGSYSPETGGLHIHNRLVYVDAEGCTFNTGRVISDNGAWAEDDTSSIPAGIYKIKGVIG